MISCRPLVEPASRPWPGGLLIALLERLLAVGFVSGSHAERSEAPALYVRQPRSNERRTPGLGPGPSLCVMDRTLGYLPSDTIENCSLLPRCALGPGAEGTLLGAAYLGQALVLWRDSVAHALSGESLPLRRGGALPLRRLRPPPVAAPRRERSVSATAVARRLLTEARDRLWAG